MIDSFTIEGPACQIASMLPLQSLVGTSGKVVFDYKRLNVGADGITTGGTMPFTYRNPAVKIKGPSPLVAQVGEPAEATYMVDRHRGGRDPPQPASRRRTLERRRRGATGGD